MVDRFVASRPDLDAADREMLLGWRDPVEGIFEVRGQAWCYVREPPAGRFGDRRPPDGARGR